MSSIKSMTDAAYDVMLKRKRAIDFSRLWKEIVKVTGTDDSKIARFYSDLTLDNRFVALKENKWDLRERYKYSESHIDISQYELEDEEEEEEIEEESSGDEMEKDDQDEY